MRFINTTSSNSSNYRISSIVYASSATYTGDAGPASLANFNNPYSLTMDPIGQVLYIGDSGNNVIRSIFLSSQNSYPPVLCPSGQAWFSSACSGCCSCSAGNYCPGDNLQYGCPAGTYSTHNTLAPTAAPTVAPTSSFPSAMVITTIAGTGTAGSTGDGGSATSALLNAPFGIALDSNGDNVYIAEYGNQKIRMISSAGIITTIAGTGTAGSTGDGGPATSALLSSPRGVSVDSNGNVLIADTANNKIRKISTSGIITTIAGTGTAGSTGDGGRATSALLSVPFGIAVDTNGDNVYIADYGNQKIRMISTAGIITTIAGTGTAGSTGDGGRATSALLSGPRGVAVDTNGIVYVADGSNHKIRKISTAGIITTIAGTGTAGSVGDDGSATSALLNIPFGITVDTNNNLFIADYGNQKIRMISTAGIITTIVGAGTAGSTGDGGRATSALLSGPRGVLVDSYGIVYVSDGVNNKIRMTRPQVPTSSPSILQPTSQPTTRPSKGGPKISTIAFYPFISNFLSNSPYFDLISFLFSFPFIL